MVRPWRLHLNCPRLVIRTLPYLSVCLHSHTHTDRGMTWILCRDIIVLKRWHNDFCTFIALFSGLLVTFGLDLFGHMLGSCWMPVLDVGTSVCASRQHNLFEQNGWMSVNGPWLSWTFTAGLFSVAQSPENALTHVGHSYPNRSITTLRYV